MKKISFVIILVIIIVCGLALSSVIAARYFETKVTTTSGLQENPVISGNNIAWLERAEDAKNNRADIFWSDSSTNQAKRLTADNDFPIKIAITDNYIYWLDARADAPGLYSYDFAVGSPQLIEAIADFPAWAEFGGNNISASDNNVVYSLAGHAGIFYYDLASKKVTMVRDTMVNCLSLSAKKIAWSDASVNGANIHVLDLPTNSVRHITVTGQVAPLSDNVAIANNKVVWLEGLSSATEVMMYDLDSGALDKLTSAEGKNLAPKISTDFVVWSSFDSFNNKFLLATYNLATKKLDYYGQDEAKEVAVSGSSAVFVGLRDKLFDVYTLDLGKAEMLKIVAAPIVEIKKFDYTPGDLLKGSATTVYYFGTDGKRYVFPNTKCFLTWYPDYTKLTILRDDQLAKVEIGGYITYRPGARIIRLAKDNKIYAVDRGGVRRLISSTDLAKDIFGADWQKLVEVIPDKFWNNYTDGTILRLATDYDRAALLRENITVNTDRNIK